MSTTPPPVLNPSPTLALRRFATDFFALFGADVTPLDADPAGELRVVLPPPLVDLFGEPHLHLRFHAAEGKTGDLVAFGSRIFDRMLAYLETRSALTVLRLPRRFAGGEELLKAVRPANVGVTGLKMAEQVERWLAFHWRITYRADDKREEIFTTIVDEDGALVAQYGDESAPAAGPTLDTLLQDGEPLPVERDDTGAMTAPKLPPMTQQARLAEQARKYAVYHADLRCIEHEADILPRLHKTLSRLTNYYNQQIEEVYDAHDPDGARRRALETDLERKIAEEVENHRLRVQITLFNHALFDVPTATATVTLSDGRHRVDVRVARNLYTGLLRLPHCHACRTAKPIAALDRNGHLTCDECITQCDGCGEIFCAECGVASCPVCGRRHCDDCSRECRACGQRACVEHIDRCPVCGDLVCLACQSICAACGVRQCRSHLRVDCVGESETPALICPACAVRCPGCRQFSAQVELCDLSGQRFCRNCLVTCGACGCRVGPGFYATDPQSGAARCHRCALPCARCGRYVTEAAACSVCGAAGCATCLPQCDGCHALLCADHAQQMPGCDHIVCPAHRTECAVGQETTCLVCRPPCAICDRPYCADHAVHCKRCQREFCAECVRVSGLCDSCATIDRDGRFVALVDEPCADDVRVQLLLPHFRWLRLDNLRYTYYLGRDAQMQAALIVVERTAGGDIVQRATKLGLLDTQHRERWL